MVRRSIRLWWRGGGGTKKEEAGWEKGQELRAKETPCFVKSLPPVWETGQGSMRDGCVFSVGNRSLRPL